MSRNDHRSPSGDPTQRIDAAQWKGLKQRTDATPLSSPCTRSLKLGIASTCRLFIVLCVGLCTVGLVAPAVAAECATQTFKMYADGLGSDPVANEALRSELGEDVKFCSYSLAQEALEDLEGCSVRSISFEGTEPAPRLVTVVNGWDELAVQAEPKQVKGDIAWQWSSEGVGCAETGCLEGGPFLVRLYGRGYGLTDGVENCPWTRVQAKVEFDSVP